MLFTIWATREAPSMYYLKKVLPRAEELCRSKRASLLLGKRQCIWVDVPVASGKDSIRVELDGIVTGMDRNEQREAGWNPTLPTARPPCLSTPRFLVCEMRVLSGACYGSKQCLAHSTPPVKASCYLEEGESMRDSLGIWSWHCSFPSF